MLIGAMQVEEISAFSSVLSMAPIKFYTIKAIKLKESIGVILE